ncbi:hypothetical protein BH11CYA1_BH11CYA1_00740 [soil metagenome]
MRHRKSKKLLNGNPGFALLISLGILFGQIGLSSPATAVPDFKQAKADYETGKYSQALSSFQALSAAYPTNALVHYYMGLCHQNLGHMGQAKAEYQTVINSRQPSLAPMAAAGLATLSRASSGSSASAPSRPAASDTGVRVATAKVKKVLEFWAEW